MSGYTLLEELDCSHNLLISLNVSGCTALEGLDCSYNQLANVDVNKNAALKRFDCSRNQLTSLDVSGCQVLISLNCRYNYMDANMLNTLFRTLNRLPLLSKVIYIGNNGPNYDGSGTAGCDQRLAHNFDRGGLYWTVYE
jgi:Leucine-rich repeat (LRR) protein